MLIDLELFSIPAQLTRLTVHPMDAVERWYEVWLDGYVYLATGQEGVPWVAKAERLGSWQGYSFRHACRRALLARGSDMRFYNEEDNTFWIQKFFDNETDARRSNG